VQPGAGEVLCLLESIHSLCISIAGALVGDAAADGVVPAADVAAVGYLSGRPASQNSPVRCRRRELVYLSAGDCDPRNGSWYLE
jgi:hypothetical protein